MEALGALVIDNGSDTIKAGFSGKHSPHTVFPTVVAHRDAAIMDSCSKTVFVGDEAVVRRDRLSLKSPIQQGIVHSWDDMEQIWQHTFDNILYVNTQEHPILLTESPVNPTGNLEKMIEIMFETFSVPAMYAATPPVLALLASGRTGGVVLDVGHGASHAMPIYEGYRVRYALEHIDFAGQHLSEYIIKLLHKRGYSYKSAEDRDTVREIKEKLAYVALDFDAEMEKIKGKVLSGKHFKLPDGRAVKIDNERLLFQCPELLFRPATEFGTTAVGVHRAIHNAIMKVGADFRSKCYNNIILCGGSTCFRGMRTRLAEEMAAIAPATEKIEVVAPPGREYSAWVGGSILSALDIPIGWIHMEEYKDTGRSIAGRKCI